MANYVSTNELNNYLWTSWEDTLINILNWIATARINNFLWVTDLNAVTGGQEKQDYNWKTQYLLKELNPSNLTLVNGSSVVGSVNITWRLLSFEYAPINTDNIFNKITFTYNYWFTTIPEDIKAVVYEIVWQLYNTRKAVWVSSFTQWQITVSFTNDDNLKIENIMKWGLKKYIKNNIYC